MKTKILGIIAEELGISVSELYNGQLLEFLGLDYLMSLTICGRLRQSLGLRVSPDMFYLNPQVGQVKSYISDHFLNQ